MAPQRRALGETTLLLLVGLLREGGPGSSAEVAEGGSADTSSAMASWAPATAAAGGCTLQSGVEFIGSDVDAPHPAPDAAACCAECRADAACDFFTWCELGGAGVCLRKGKSAPGFMRHNSSCVSGLLGSQPPAPPPPPDVSVAVAGGVRWRGGANHVCWNIDASINRGFFWRNLSAAVPHSEGWQLARQAAAIGAAQEAGFSLMRFGGSVGDPFCRQPALRG